MADPVNTEGAPLEFPDITAMTDKSELLAALSDVHVPEVSAWPALGWWLLALALIACIGGLMFFWRARRQNAANAWRREALAELTVLKQALPQASDTERHALVRRSSALLRRVMMHVEGREQTAALTDAEWLAALNARATVSVLTPALQALVTDVPYETAPSDQATKKNIKALLKWMTQFIDNLPQQSNPPPRRPSVTGDSA